MSIAAALSLARRYRSGGRVETNPPMRIKKHINFQGLQISIETPKGEIRRGIDHEGKPWANRMAVDYGYIRRTEGKDGDQVDVFVGPNRKSDKVFIIDQLHHHMEKFDEHKCLVGFNDKKQALTAYHASYGRKYGAHHTIGAVTELSIDAFKEWLNGGGGKKPVSPEVPMAKGGMVKASKETANYRLGTKAEHCAKCSMFRPPDSCTAVEGKIRTQDTCDYFEKKKGMAKGGKVRTYTMPLKPGSSDKVKSQNIREFHTGPTYAATKAKFGKARADRQAIAVALSNARKYGKKKAFGGPNIESMIERGSLYNLRREGMINSTIPGRTDKHPMNVPAGSYVLPADIPSALGQGNTMAGGEILKKMFSSGPYGMAPMRVARSAPRPMSMRMPTPHMKASGGGIDGDGDDYAVNLFTDVFTKHRTAAQNRYIESTRKYPFRLGLGPAAPEEYLSQQRRRDMGEAEDISDVVPRADGGKAHDHVPIIAAGGEYIIHPEVVRDIGHGSLKAGHKVLDAFVLRVRKKNIETLKKLPGPKR